MTIFADFAQNFFIRSYDLANFELLLYCYHAFEPDFSIRNADFLIIIFS